MAKFFNLVYNEYIKLARKAGTWVMLGLLIISCVGFPVLIKISSSVLGYYDDPSYRQQQYQDQYDFNEKNDVETAKIYKKLADIDPNTENYIFIVDKIESYIWPLYYENSGLNSEQKALYQKVIDAYIDGDAKTIYNAEIDLIKGTIGDEAQIADAIFPYQYLLDNNVPLGEKWQFNLASEYITLKNKLATLDKTKENGGSVIDKEYNKTKEDFLKTKYQLDNKIQNEITVYTNLMEMGTNVESQNSMWAPWILSSVLISLLTTLIVIIAGGIVSSEFKEGTIKILLINPVKRYKILLAKYFTLVTTCIIGLLAIVGVLFVVTFIIYGGKGIDTPQLLIVNDNVVEISGFKYMIKEVLMQGIDTLVFGTMAFALSSLMKSSAFSTGVSLAVLLAGGTIADILLLFGLDFGRYLIFVNTNLSNIQNGLTGYENHTVPFAIGVIVVHMIIFLVTAYDGFVRKEV